MADIRYPLVKSEYDRVWKHYCAFLDLSIEQFLSIQEALLLRQLQKTACCSLGQKIIGRRVPRTLDDFRRLVPLTTYDDYLPELEKEAESALPEKPYVWTQTSGAGAYRRVPFTIEAYNKSLDSLMAVFLLACSRRRGHSSISEGDKVLYNVAPGPYLSGILAKGASDTFNLKTIMPAYMHDNLDFKDKVTMGFETSLRTGVDIMVAMTSVLVKTGNEFRRLSKRSRVSQHLMHPRAFWRMGQAFLRSRIEGRNILPKDVWPVKALIGWGVDTRIYREQVYRDWGAYPYEFHACTEAGIMAVQSWTRKDLTFIPYSNFFEFIPELEWERARNDIFYEPATVLLSEVKPGERYELVVTSFHGMPFIRYRLGHLIRITSLCDKEAGINLPQMVFEARSDGLIDIAGFTRICEATVLQALSNSSFEFEDWFVRKEMEEGKPHLHLYIEPKRDFERADPAAVLHSELTRVDQGYRDLAAMMEISPLRMTVLPPGTFRDFYRMRASRGFKLAQRYPARVNAPDEVVYELTSMGAVQTVMVR